MDIYELVTDMPETVEEETPWEKAVMATLHIIMNKVSNIEAKTDLTDNKVDEMVRVATDIGKFAENFGSSKIGKMFGSK